MTSGEREEEGEVVGVKAISLIFSFRASRPEICDAVRGERDVRHMRTCVQAGGAWCVVTYARNKRRPRCASLRDVQ